MAISTVSAGHTASVSLPTDSSLTFLATTGEVSVLVTVSGSVTLIERRAPFSFVCGPYAATATVTVTCNSGSVSFTVPDDVEVTHSSIDSAAVQALIAATTDLGAMAPAVQALVDASVLTALDRTNHVGQDAMRVLTKTANYTLQNADLRDPTIILANSANPLTIFYPANASVSVAAGVPVEIVQWGTGAVTLAGASGVTVVSAGTPTTKARYASLICRKVQTNTVLVSQGELASGGPLLVTPPSIAGTGIQGDTLTLTEGTYTPDGTHTRQWRRVNLSTGAITNVGAGNTTYASVAGDVGFGVDCVETVTDAAGLATQGVSNRITIVAAASKPVNTGAPFVVAGSSSAVDGQVTMNVGVWSNSPTGYKIQRKLDGVNSGSVVDQAGTTLAYTIQAGEEGKNLSWSVVAYNGSGDADVAAVSPNWPVAGTAPQFTTNPQITYSATTVGSVLTCADGTTNVPCTITRVWGFSDPPYSGTLQPLQTGSTYTTITDDVGSQLWCDVTATNSAGFVTVRALGPTITGAVTPPPPPPPPSSSAGPRVGSFTPSGPITAVSGQLISGLSFSGSGVQITIPQNVTGVTIEDCDVSTSGSSCILNQGTNTTIRFCNIHDSPRGILTNTGTGTTIEYCTFDNFSAGSQYEGHAIETDYSIGPTTIRFNEFTGSNYASDVVSHFQTSRVTFTDNVFDVQIDEPSGAAFTIGDGLDQNHPGRDNYVARNVVTQSGGVPAGVFGSEGNTILEYNCFKAGIQAYDYNGNLFLGVIVRKNVINIGASFVPMTPADYGGPIAWSSNVDGTNCALMPA